MRRRLLLLGFVLPVLLLVGYGVSASTTGADRASIGAIVLSGGEITVLREGVQLRVDAGPEIARDDAVEVSLFSGDQLSTGVRSFAEIRLATRHGVVRIAENTTIVLENPDGSGEYTIRLVYGRLRARVEPSAPDAHLEVHGLIVTAGARSADFGYDQVADPATGALVDTIYVFDGEVRVAAVTAAQLATTLPSGRMIVVTADTRMDGVEIVGLTDAVSRLRDWEPAARDPVPERVVEESRTEVVRSPPLVANDSARAAVEQAGDPDDASRVPGRGLRTAGVVLTGLGLLTDVVAVGLYYFGAELVPGWSTDYNRFLGPAAAAGVGLMAGGIIMIMISLGMGD